MFSQGSSSDAIDLSHAAPASSVVAAQYAQMLGLIHSPFGTSCSPCCSFLGLPDHRSRQSVIRRSASNLLNYLTLIVSFVLASTQELHEKIAELAQRVRDLEDALRVTHSQLSSQGHPLLSDELLKIKAPLQRDPPANKCAALKSEDTNVEVIDAFGSLSISVSGRTTYYGSIANSWVRLCAFISRTTLTIEK